MTFLRVIALAVVLAATTLLPGWWSIPIVTALYALLRRNITAPGEAALAALLAWGALLARVALVPAFGVLLRALGGIFPMPGFVLAIVAVLFAVGLAWSAAKVVTVLVVRPKPVA